MNRSSHATPMDFEYQNGTGPIDGNSPFLNLAQPNQRPASSAMNSPSKRRQPGAFPSSPAKHRVMGAQASSPSKPAAFHSIFTTPRNTSKMDIDDSSAGETPRSPENQPDSDATPEMHSSRALTNLDLSAAPTLAGAERSGRNSPTKDRERPRPEKRDSWFGSFVTKTKHKLSSPNRGDTILRGDNPSRIEKSVTRRRKRDVDRHVRRARRHSMSDSDADADGHPPTSPRKISSSQQPPMLEKEPHWMSKLFGFIAAHPTVPEILSFYAQLAFNFFLLAFCAYVIYSFWAAINADVDEMAFNAAGDIYAQIDECRKSYDDNRCVIVDARPPALHRQCEEWARCIDRDPMKVGRARLSARTFAEIFNNFVEPISYKAMAFSIILIFGCFAISNFAFSLVRNKAQQYNQYQPPYQQPPYNFASPPPPTPQRSFSGQDAYYPGTPYQSYGMEPLPSQGYGQIEGRGSPVKRLDYHR